MRANAIYGTRPQRPRNDGGLSENAARAMRWNALLAMPVCAIFLFACLLIMMPDFTAAFAVMAIAFAAGHAFWLWVYNKTLLPMSGKVSPESL
jgi:hypothetical protein